MRLTRLAGDCPSGETCPTIYATDRDTIVVQGYTLGDHDLAGIAMPDGEAAVEIPASLLRKAADAGRR
jgi:hypothetical protein